MPQTFLDYGAWPCRHLAGHLWRVMLADEIRIGRASSEAVRKAS
jgi:hypothetical protein